MAGAAEARRHLERLASAPRPAGGSAERDARQYAASVLVAHGFRVREEPFSYSAFPGRFATPLFGVASILLLFTAGHFGATGRPRTAALVLFFGAIGSLVIIAWLIRRGVLAVPFARSTSTNLVAERGSPVVWLVAHLDSKSQPIPIVVRAIGVVLTIFAWAAALLVAVIHLRGAAVSGAWPVIALVGLVAGIPVALSVVGAKSPGALDNASGMAAALVAVSALAREIPVGVLFTSAEELGLAGARAWAREHRSGTAINFDGVDDHGVLRLTYSGACPQNLVALLHQAASSVGIEAKPARLVPGVLVDGVALAQAGWQVITVSRGSLSTVARIHTPTDNLDRLTGEGIAEVAAVAAHVVVALTASSAKAG